MRSINNTLRNHKILKCIQVKLMSIDITSAYFTLALVRARVVALMTGILSGTIEAPRHLKSGDALIWPGTAYRIMILINRWVAQAGAWQARSNNFDNERWPARARVTRHHRNSNICSSGGSSRHDLTYGMSSHSDICVMIKSATIIEWQIREKFQS